MLENLMAERKKKLEQYKKIGNPYPAEIKRDYEIGQILKDFNDFEKNKNIFFVVGRIFSLRNQGKIIFADFKDESGSIQLVFNEKETKDFKILNEVLDIADFIEVCGEVFRTKRGEKSILVKNARVISKSLRPLPAAWYGLEDTEIRFRKRYLDILMHPETKEVFYKKTIFWEAIRGFLKNAKFLEVETPVLENIPGGAEAEPFITHHNALDSDFYLRISLELPLKKLLVAGYEKVFEIGRVFRNEGIDREHLQDYTQMECYWAYKNYEDMMKFIETLYKEVIKKTFGTLEIQSNGCLIDWGKEWKKIEYTEIFKNETGINLKKAKNDDLLKKAKELNIKFEENFGRGKLIDLIYKKIVRPKLIEPSFLINPPIELEPLAKKLENDPSRVARFQIMALGTELGKGFSELNDPIDQRQRFEEQMKLREQGDKEAQRLDEEFLEALEYGMPPAAGFGMSERLFAVLIDKPVREAVFFPLMRAE